MEDASGKQAELQTRGRLFVETLPANLALKPETPDLNHGNINTNATSSNSLVMP